MDATGSDRGINRKPDNLPRVPNVVSSAGPGSETVKHKIENEPLGININVSSDDGLKATVTTTNNSNVRVNPGFISGFGMKPRGQ